VQDKKREEGIKGHQKKKILEACGIVFKGREGYVAK
jgi:predicted nucleic acid-binding Zn ribbon protein